MARTIPLYTSFRGTKYFGSLDGLRCLSILAVIFHHTVATEFSGLRDRGIGTDGVRLFFVISGFLITTLLLREREQTGTIDLRRFYIRRTLRIFPLYYTILGVYVLVVLATDRNSVPGHQFFKNLPAFATYTSNWFVDQTPARVIFVFAWSLATEEQFYLFWPGIQKHLRGIWASVAILLLLALSVAAQLGAFGPVSALPVVILASIAPPICLGVLLAQVLHSPKGFALIAKLWTPLNSLIFLVIAGFSIAVSFPGSGYVVDLSLLGLLASCVMAERHALTPILSIPIVRSMGIVSYGVYLMHMLAYNGVKMVLGKLHLGQPIVAFFGTVVAAFLIASLSFKFYESIFLRYKERFSVQREPSAVST